MRIDRCHNIGDFRTMAKRRLPGPIFHYIDGAADDEVTYRRNTEAYDRCDLVPNVLAGVERSGGGSDRLGSSTASAAPVGLRLRDASASSRCWRASSRCFPASSLRRKIEFCSALRSSFSSCPKGF